MDNRNQNDLHDTLRSIALTPIDVQVERTLDDLTPYCPECGTEMYGWAAHEDDEAIYRCLKCGWQGTDGDLERLIQEE